MQGEPGRRGKKISMSTIITEPPDNRAHTTVDNDQLLDLRPPLPYSLRDSCRGALRLRGCSIFDRGMESGIRMSI